jgi:peptide/nickel transport system permease protein
MGIGSNPLVFEEATEGTPAAAVPSGGEATSSGGLAIQVLRVFIENKLAVVGAVIILLMVLFCFLGPVFYHTNQTNAQLALLNSSENAAPGNGHLLGTDANGFDILGRIMFGGQTSLEVGFAAAGIATFVGVLWGAIAGFFGGIVDTIMMRIVDILLSIPLLFLLIVLAVIFQSSLGLLILVIGFTAWLIPARLVRGETLVLRVREFVQAVRVMGGTSRRIVLRHIVPNTLGTIIVNATFQVADAILYLAALGFIGIGVPSPQTDWGTMLSDGVNYAASGYWWEIYPAGVAIVLIVVALNFVGDALRDAFEVRLQRR